MPFDLSPGACQAAWIKCPPRQTLWIRCNVRNEGRLPVGTHSLTNSASSAQPRWPSTCGRLHSSLVSEARFKNGLLHHLFKRKSDRCDCTAYRGILLLSSLGNCLHRANMPKLAAHSNSAALDLQIGGKQGQTTHFAAHAVRSFVRKCVQLQHSCAVLLADIQAAYYGAVRELTASKVTQAEAEMICQADSWLCRITAELNDTTWMDLALPTSLLVCCCEGSWSFSTP